MIPTIFSNYKILSQNQSQSIIFRLLGYSDKSQPKLLTIDEEMSQFSQRIDLNKINNCFNIILQIISFLIFF